jgi:hypothetical protein
VQDRTGQCLASRVVYCTLAAQRSTRAQSLNNPPQTCSPRGHPPLQGPSDGCTQATGTPGSSAGHRSFLPSCTSTRTRHRTGGPTLMYVIYRLAERPQAYIQTPAWIHLDLHEYIDTSIHPLLHIRTGSPASHHSTTPPPVAQAAQTGGSLVSPCAQ